MQRYLSPSKYIDFDVPEVRSLAQTLAARGNKPGVNAQFHPPREALAFAIKEPQERDLPEIWAEPLAVVVEVLERYASYDQVLAHLPDIELLNRSRDSAQ